MEELLHALKRVNVFVHSVIFLGEGRYFRSRGTRFLRCQEKAWHLQSTTELRVCVCVRHFWGQQQLIKMLLLSNRIKFCSLAFTAARLYSNGPATANKNPTVYFDIAADSQPLGRVTFEVRRDYKKKTNMESTVTPFYFLFPTVLEFLVLIVTLIAFILEFCSSTQMLCPKLQVTSLEPPLPCAVLSKMCIDSGPTVPSRELPSSVHRRTRLRLQGIHFPQGDPSVHVPGTTSAPRCLTCGCRWTSVRSLVCVSGGRLHQPQWNWRKIHLRLEVSRRELQTEAHRTRY